MGVDPEIKAITSIEKGLAYLRHHDVIEVHLLRKAPTRIKLTASLNYPLSILLHLTCTVNVLSTAYRHVHFRTDRHIRWKLTPHHWSTLSNTLTNAA